jgi:hypothetical protein
MIAKKRSRSFDTSILPKEKLFLKHGILFFNIPIGINLDSIGESLSCEKLIPKFNKDHLRLAYFVFATISDRKKLRKEFLSDSKDIEHKEFSINSISLEKTFENLSYISQNLIEFYQKYIESKQENSLGSNINTEIDIAKSLSLEILCNNYHKIKKALLYLSEQSAIQEEEEETENLKWILIFYWAWYVSSKLTIQNLRYYLYFFRTQAPGALIPFFNFFDRCNRVLKFFAVDIIFQYFYFEDAFNYRDEVINSVYPIIRNNQISKFSDFCTSKVNLFKSIFKSEPLKNYFGIDLKKFIKEFFENIYLVKNFPPSFQGITLFNRKILIKKLYDSIEEYELTAWDLH